MDLHRPSLPTTRGGRSAASRAGASAAALTLLLGLGACAAPAEESTDSAAETSPSTSESAEPSPTAESPSPSTSPSKSPSRTKAPEPSGPTLAVGVEGGAVTPNAKELSVDVGEPLTITVTADRAGELHVHSKPEQYVQFESGRSEQELVIETPGTVEIEEHETGAVVALVQVS